MQNWQSNKKFKKVWTDIENSIDIIHHKKDNKPLATTASVFYKEQRLVGGAFCNSNDAFSKSVGRNIAIGRLQKFIASKLKLVKWNPEYRIISGPKNTKVIVDKLTDKDGKTIPSIKLVAAKNKLINTKKRSVKCHTAC